MSDLFWYLKSAVYNRDTQFCLGLWPSIGSNISARSKLVHLDVRYISTT